MKRPLEVDRVRVLAGPEHADCGQCELHSVCHGPKARPVLGERPSEWAPGGLMIIGDAPSREDSVYGRPFVGQAGRLLDRLLRAVDIDRNRVWFTHAVLGVPPRSQGKTQPFHKRFPSAVHACLPRLEAEIAAARPRVIVPMGQVALDALTGYEETRQRHVDNPCSNPRCRPKDRKVGPVIACAVGSCDWYALAPLQIEELEGQSTYAEQVKVWRDQVMKEHGGKCPSCGGNLKRLRPRRMKCPQCGGRKRRVEEYVAFERQYSLWGRDAVAGAIFRAEDLPARLDEFGVRFIVPTYHPNYLRVPPRKGAFGGQFAAPMVCETLLKAKRLLRSEPRWKDPTPKVVHHTDIDQVRRWLSSPGRYSVDLETNSYDGPIPFVNPEADEGVGGVTEVAVVGFSRVDRDEVLVVDTRGLRGSQGPFQQLLREFFSRDDVDTVFMNGSYDRLVCWYVWGVWCDNQGGELLYAHNVLEPDAMHGLGHQAHEFLDAPHWKGEGRKLKPGEKDSNSGYDSFEKLALYNARDCKITIMLDALYRGPTLRTTGKLHEEKLWQVYEQDLINHELAIRMTVAGMPLQRHLLQGLRGELARQRDEALDKMRRLLNDDSFVPRGRQLLDALYVPNGPCGFPVLSTTATGQPSTDKPTLKRLEALWKPGQTRETYELPSLVLKYRAASYVVSHYIDSDGIRWGLDGRLHPLWKPLLVTGRWSTEPNVQNWPSLMRAAFEAPPGRMLVGADYAQLELRIMADLSADDRLIDLILNADESDKLNPEKDPHSFLAARVFGKAFLDGDASERKLLRDVTKRIWYGSLYGAGATTIADSISNSDYDGPPLQRALVEQVLAAIVREFPGVQRWRTEQVSNLYRNLAVYTPGLGRRRHFPLGEVEVTVGYNFPIQGAAADLMNWRMGVLAFELERVDPSAFIFAQVHDAVYVECAEDRAEDVKRLITDTLTVEHSFGGGKAMRYEASAKYDKNWGVIS